MHKGDARQHARAVVAIPFHDVLCPVQRGIGAASAPERGVDSGVELVMNGQEIPNVVPLIAVVAVVTR